MSRKQSQLDRPSTSRILPRNDDGDSDGSSWGQSPVYSKRKAQVRSQPRTTNSFDDFEVRIVARKAVIVQEQVEESFLLDPNSMDPADCVFGSMKKSQPIGLQVNPIGDVRNVSFNEHDDVITIEETFQEENKEDIVSLYSARSASSLARRLTGLQEVDRVDPRTPQVERSERPPAVQLIEDQPTTSHAGATQAPRKEAVGPPSPTTPKRTPTKRLNAHALSPTKTIKKGNFRTSYDPKIKTFVFFDFETTGFFPEERGLEKQHCDQMWKNDPGPKDLHDFLDKAIRMTSIATAPRITQFAFCAIPRMQFEENMKRMEEKARESPNSSLHRKMPCNVTSRMINPGFVQTTDWASYNKKQRVIPEALLFEARLLQSYSTFDKEWPSVLEFLNAVPKPACLVAHNGLMFDMRVLYFELKRYGFLEKNMGVPKDIFFIDTLLATREIDLEYRDSVENAITTVDFGRIYAVIASMTPGRIHSIPEEGNGDEGSQHVMVAEGESEELASDEGPSTSGARQSKSNPILVNNDKTPLARSQVSAGRSQGTSLLRSKSSVGNRTPSRSKPIQKSQSSNFATRYTWI
ncbi:hypothetical protein WR25_13116 isoform B [Diploscapter pachys]|uniref:Exonuclease domain-containing protein n=1 Tax=Diploscapter pachys TaxID=2018661 RepID=A0A2A2KCJ1_9BILA|nr:hypothetical protein WR25_13116 isoform A [Diploscapter pachys]PAV71651.1 hypothetical protein WR25_13116 isoform B [Diploscapter pachys]